MADVEVVIKIPREDYEYIKNSKDFNFNVIKNGTPLPKGHGRLIDADAFIDTLGCSDRDIYAKACIEEDAPTILEADKTEREE